MTRETVIRELKYGEGELWQEYLQFRWEQLRKPLGLPPGSELDELDSRAFHLIGCLSGKTKILAAGRLHWNTAQEAQVRYMAVAEAYRGCGMGSKILEGLCREAGKRSPVTLTLNAREEVIPFYERHGFSQVENGRFDYLGITHQKMSKIV